MSAEVAQNDGGTEFKNIDEETEKSIRAALRNHRFVNGITVERHKVQIDFDSDGTFYDSDAVIGQLVRKWNLDYVGEHQGRLHFVNF